MYTITMNTFAHATTKYHVENNSVMHWIQTDGVKFLLVTLVTIALFFGIKKLIDSKESK